MTREQFIRKWLSDYTEEQRDQMREDLDSVIQKYQMLIDIIKADEKDGLHEKS